ncbi:MAG: hypothetical protein IPH52_10510 [Leptospiraceae bacterium]|nr:hypothetical protein [Leptospiraceae bacterium]
MHNIGPVYDSKGNKQQKLDFIMKKAKSIYKKNGRTDYVKDVDARIKEL